MPTNLALLFLILAGLALAFLLLVIFPALAMSGHQSDLERQAEIEAAQQRSAQSAEGPDNAD